MKYSIKKLAKDSYILFETETGRILHQGSNKAFLYMFKRHCIKVDKEHAEREALIQEYLVRNPSVKRYGRSQKELAQAAT